MATDILLDTHALMWWVDDDARLSGAARAAVFAASRVFASHVSLWELAIKSAIGRIALAPSAERWFSEQVAATRFVELPINKHHIGAVERLPLHHRDPFDRLLICQAIEDGLTIISKDQAFREYDVDVAW